MDSWLWVETCALWNPCDLENFGAISPKPQMISSEFWTTNCYQYGNSKNLIWLFGNVIEMHPFAIQLDAWRSRLPLFGFLFGKIRFIFIHQPSLVSTDHPSTRTPNRRWCDRAGGGGGRSSCGRLGWILGGISPLGSDDSWLKGTWLGPKDHLTLQWKGLNLHNRSVLVLKIASFYGFRILSGGVFLSTI